MALQYRFGGKEKRTSLGVYSDVSLKDAHERRDAARKLLASGVDPSEHRKAQKAARAEAGANSFEVVAREWHAKHSGAWDTDHAKRTLSRLNRDIFPWIGSRPIAEITPPELLSVMRRIETRGALHTAHRALANCGQVFRYAVATGRVERDPTGDLQGALPPAQGKHFAAVTEPKRAGDPVVTHRTYMLPIIGQTGIASSTTTGTSRTSAEATRGATRPRAQGERPTPKRPPTRHPSVLPDMSRRPQPQ